MLSYTTLWNIAISELACPVCWAMSCWKWTCSLWSQWHCENFNRKLANCCFGQRNQNLDKWPKFISWVHSDVKFSVVWDLICSVMFKIYRFTNLLLNILVKEFWNLVNIWKSCFLDVFGPPYILLTNQGWQRLFLVCSCSGEQCSKNTIH